MLMDLLIRHSGFNRIHHAICEAVAALQERLDPTAQRSAELHTTDIRSAQKTHQRPFTANQYANGICVVSRKI